MSPIDRTDIAARTWVLIGKASGTLSMLRQLGGTFGVALCVTVFGRFGDRATPQDFCDGFAAASSVAAMPSLAGALAACCLPSTARARLCKLAKPDIA
jgi:hypothetical protein